MPDKELNNKSLSEYTPLELLEMAIKGAGKGINRGAKAIV